MRVAILGSTGLIGSHLLHHLIEDPDITNIKAIARREVSFGSPKVESVTISFQDEFAFKVALIGMDVVYCAVGTTRKKAGGNNEAYRQVDYTIPVNAAQFSFDAGCSSFILVSSLGADNQSNNFYLKLKGEVEEHIGKIPFSSFIIFRPSLLLGKRDEFRLGEWLAQFFIKPLAFLLPARIKPILAKDVAMAMWKASKIKGQGIQIFHYKEIKALIR